MQSMLQQRSRLAAQCKIAREKLNAVKGVDRTTPEVIGFYETTVSSCDRSLVELVEPIVFNAKALATHLELELQKNIAYTEARLSHLAVLQIERSVLEVLVKTGSN